jgi:hypothetical protein
MTKIVIRDFSLSKQIEFAETQKAHAAKKSKRADIVGQIVWAGVVNKWEHIIASLKELEAVKGENTFYKELEYVPIEDRANTLTP